MNILNRFKEAKNIERENLSLKERNIKLKLKLSQMVQKISLYADESIKEQDIYDVLEFIIFST